MPRVVYELSELYGNPNLSDARYAQEPQLVGALLNRQTARSAPILTSGKCVGAKVWFYDAGASDTVYSGTVANPSNDCDTEACGVGQTVGKDLDNNLFIDDCKAAQEERCDNELEFAQETAKVLYHLMYQMRVNFQKRVLNTFMLAAQQNQVPTGQMPSYMLERSNSNILQIDHANMVEAEIYNTLVDIDTLSQQNSLFDPIYLNGRNFRNSKILAEYNALNLDQRSQSAIYNAIGRNMLWDNHIVAGVDTVTTELSTIAVSPNAYLFWNYVHYPTVPVMKDASKNLWVFSIEDPFLTYNDNGTIKKVMYDVEHTYACTGRNANGDLVYLHNYKIFLRGGFQLSPLGFDMAGTSQVYTGVMHYVVNADSGS